MLTDIKIKLSKLKKKLKKDYAKSYFKWRFVDNLPTRIDYAFNQPQMSEAEQKLFRELKENGIAMTHVDELPGIRPLFDALDKEVTRLEEEQKEQMDKLRIKAGEVSDDKTFLFEVLGNEPTFNLNNPFTQFALNKTFIRVADAYYNMFAQLRYYSVWHNFTSNKPALRSQLWHRDRDDKAIIKFFVYLKDVDEGTGPFTYAKNTHWRGTVKADAEHFYEEGRSNPRSYDEQMEKLVDKKDWLTVTGKKGSLIVADTSGYHKGGLARTDDRLLFTFMFCSPASAHEPNFSRPKLEVNDPELQKTLAYLNK